MSDAGSAKATTSFPILFRSGIGRAPGRNYQRQSFSRTLLGLVFVVAGALHFVSPETYERIMPSYLPLHRELVYLSGALEISGGVGVFSERARRVAGIGLALLLFAVWPANLQMLLDARSAGKPAWWVALLWARLPLQVLLMAWVWRASGLHGR